MVSFSCENCGDVVTKKKLDAHRGYCHGASFTCLDCMTHFRGTDYREHTSCITEAQKYEGKHYKEKPKKKSVFIAAPGDEVALQPYVEEVPDEPSNGAVVVVESIPEAPSPPRTVRAQPKQNVNVFDFLVDETPNASKVSLEQMSMVADAPPIFKSVSPTSDHDDESRLVAYETNGFTYGNDPIHSQSYDTYRTPASKPVRRTRQSLSTEKKRKRHLEELDLTRAIRSSSELDEEMADMDGSGRPMLHSGLTGGLHRLLSSSQFPPSPDENAPVDSPLSPAKRKRAVAASTTGTVNSGRESSAPTDKRGRRRHASGQVLKVRKVRRSSDESRPRKHHRGHRERSENSHSPPSKQKAIEYYPEGSPARGADNQMVVYTSRAELFLSLVSKGPESSSGYSINKALKRYHRERGQSGTGRDAKSEEEKELWKNLRLKRNERGEVVLFMGP